MGQKAKRQKKRDAGQTEFFEQRSPVDVWRAEIESESFAVRLGVASDLPVFIAGALAEPATREITVAANLDYEITGRLGHLTSLQFDPRFVNPKDTALAVYLLILKQRGSAGLARRHALRTRNGAGLWWARRMADWILGSGD